jgi:undecaprenyl-diphosphatase
MLPRVRPVWPATALTAFVVLLALTVGGWAPLDRLDAAVSEAFRGYGGRRPAVVRFLRVATDVASTWLFVPAGVAVAVLLGVRGARRAALFCLAVTATVPLLWGLMHWLLLRPRPVAGFVVVDSNGFPSGHTSNAAAAAVVAVLLLWPRLRGWRRPAVAVLAVAFAVFVGLTRVALLAHWPSDVAGGWLLGLGVVPLLAWTTGGPHAGRGGSPPGGRFAGAGSPRSPDRPGQG